MVTTTALHVLSSQCSTAVSLWPLVPENACIDYAALFVTAKSCLPVYPMHHVMQKAAFFQDFCTSIAGYTASYRGQDCIQVQLQMHCNCVAPHLCSALWFRVLGFDFCSAVVCSPLLAWPSLILCLPLSAVSAICIYVIMG